MKNVIFKYGTISGIILGVLMVATAFLFDVIGYGYAISIQYVCMIMGFLPILLGVRRYRDDVKEGVLSFGNAFVMTIATALFANLFYVVAWLIIYYNKPGFMDGLVNYVVGQMKAAGQAAKDINDYLEQVKKIKEEYANPFNNAFATYLKLLLPTIFFSLIGGLILRRKASSGMLHQ